MTKGQVRTFSCLPAAAAAILSWSCGNGLAPIVMVNPTIDSLRFDSFFSRAPDSGIVAVYAQLADTSVRLGPNERIPVRVTVHGGDEETMTLEHHVCFLPGPTACTLVSVGTRSGHTVDEIGDLLSAIPARWWVIGVSRTNGAARVFDSRRVDDAITALRRHPAVASAERDGIGAPAVSPPPHFPSQLLATLPLDYGSPKLDDGRVQGQKGGLMTVRYTQPGGPAVTHTMVIP